MQSARPARILMKLSGRTRPLMLGEHHAPSVSSASTSWLGLPFELHRMRPAPLRGPIEAGPIAGDFGLLVILDGEVELLTRDGHRLHHSSGRAGSVMVLSGDALQRFEQLKGAARAAAINVSPAWLERMELTGRWQRKTFAEDPTVLGFAHTIRDELASGAGSGAVFADSISLALLSHVSERHGFGAGARSRSRGQLSGAQRERLRELIRANLGTELSLTRLSSEVGISPRHFVTLFRRAFGTSPHRYVLEQRLAAGQRLIEAGERDLAAIALAVGFSSQSHFTTAFRCSRGITPARYARATATR